MKKILLAILISFSAFSQNHTIQIELVDSDVGYVVNADPLNASCGTSSNDSGLNAIFESHNIGNYCSWAFTSYPAMSTVGGGLIDCYDCDPVALINELEEYDTVIGRARLTLGPDLFANYIHININQATPTGTTPENIVVTSNPTLNQIFENFTVFHFDNLVDNWYSIICDCYSPDLIAALIDQELISPNTVDPVTGQTTYDNYSYDHIYYLSNQQFELDQFKVYPNPFHENLQISSTSLGTEFFLFDISGKIITNTSSHDYLRTQTNAIAPGLYLLKIVQESRTKTIKLIKK